MPKREAIMADAQCSERAAMREYQTIDTILTAICQLAAVAIQLGDHALADAAVSIGDRLLFKAGVRS